MEFFFEENAEVPEAEFETKVPADYRGYYAKDNGVYKIAESFAPATKLIDGLGKTLKQTKATNQSVGLESKNRREALEKYETLLGAKSFEEAEAKLAELNQKIASKASIDPEEVRNAIKAEFDGKLTAEQTKTANMFKTLEKNLRDKDALEAISANKGNAKLLMPLILAQTKVVEGEDGEYFTAVLKPDGTIRAGADGGPMRIDKLVAEMKEDKDLASAFEGVQKSGGGPDPKAQQQQQRQPNPGYQPGSERQTQDRNGRGVSKISAGLAERR